MKVTFFLLGILLFLVACTPNPLSAIKTPTQLHAISLRSLAQERSFLVGAAVEERFMQGDPAYADLLSNQFNLLTPEDSMKFSSVLLRVLIKCSCGVILWSGIINYQNG